MLLPVLFSNYFIFKLLFHFLFLVLPRNNVINMNKVLYNTLISKGLPPPHLHVYQAFTLFRKQLNSIFIKANLFFKHHFNFISKSFKCFLHPVLFRGCNFYLHNFSKSNTFTHPKINYL